MIEDEEEEEEDDDVEEEELDRFTKTQFKGLTNIHIMDLN